jgi:PAS domain-containing protein
MSLGLWGKGVRNARNASAEATAPDAELLALIIENLPNAVYAKDAELRFLVANHVQCSMAEVAAGDILGKSDADIHPPHLAQTFMANERKLLAAGGEMTIEEEVHGSDGTITPVLTRKTVVKRADGSAVIIGTNSILTELRKREARLKLLSDAVPVGVLQVNDKGVIDFANALFQDYLGFASKPQNLREVLARLDAPPAGFPGTASRYESVARLGGKGDRRLLVICSGWQRLEGETERIAVVSLVDISEAVNLREKSAQQAGTLETVLEQARVSLVAIATSTRALNGGADTLSRQSEDQMANLEEMSAAIRQLAAAVQQNADGARDARDLAVNASVRADEGATATTAVSEMIARIADSNRRVLSITDVVKEIAFQTNLLSLNAAVEAARAGQLGRGFAVVAGEVRALAHRSATALKDIDIHIRDSKRHLDDGTELAASLGGTMSEIAASARQSAQFVQNIANACSEQASGVQQIDKSVAHLEGVAQKNARLAEQVTHAVKTVDQAIGLLASAVRSEAPAGALQRGASA